VGKCVGAVRALYGQKRREEETREEGHRTEREKSCLQEIALARSRKAPRRESEKKNGCIDGRLTNADSGRVPTSATGTRTIRKVVGRNTTTRCCIEGREPQRPLRSQREGGGWSRGVKGTDEENPQEGDIQFEKVHRVGKVLESKGREYNWGGGGKQSRNNLRGGNKSIS